MQNFAVVIGLAVIAANLPFVSNKILFFIEPSVLKKSFAIRFFELILLYCLLGALTFFLESRTSFAHKQNWPFYASTFALFIVFAWPGFVWQYFWRKTGI